MSFSAYARRVRDPALPHRRRVSALRSCVQLYRPIGFHATLSFLEEQAGSFQRDEAALLRALDALVASRLARRAELRRYAAARSAAKRRGRRSPGPDEPNPHHLRGYWYGAPGSAALHALRFWQRERRPALLPSLDPIEVRVDSCVSACLAAGGPLTPAQRQLLATAVDALDERIRPEVWRDDPAAYFRARDLLQVTRFVEIAAEAA
ncbi:hypothetical protein [Micromonospora sp. NPDC023814]|uniref:hypothetical protein n=1 Tax=Micromonospora sp. NPDC023814 TaxID=3154596 RepID=UPI0033F49575